MPDLCSSGEELRRIRSLSSRIDTCLSKKGDPECDRLDELTTEQLQDLDKIVAMADFVLCKYADQKEMYSLLKPLVTTISETAESVNELDDEITELVVSAEDSIGRVKRMHGHINDQSDLVGQFDDPSRHDGRVQVQLI